MRFPCAVPLCPHASVYRGYCDCHRSRAEGGRPTSAKRGYGGSWPAVRASYLARHPRCEFSPCTAPATDVDHRVSIAEGRKRGWTREQLDADDNLRAGCHACHSRRTALEQSGFGAGPPGGGRKVEKA